MNTVTLTNGKQYTNVTEVTFGIGQANIVYYATTKCYRLGSVNDLQVKVVDIEKIRKIS